ncbi:MAG: hypothetical protein AB7O64_14350 [Methylibium sp.]
MKPPRLALSYGQVAWVLNLGQDPPRTLLNQLNYLRQRGIPQRAPKAAAPGSGNRQTYDYAALIECGVALSAFHRGMKIADIEFVLQERGREMRRWYVRALGELPEAALHQPWVKSRGRLLPILGEEYFLTLHDRYAEQGRHVELKKEAVDPIAEAFARLRGTETPSGLISARVLPLTRLVLQWTAWALEAPEIRPGRRPANPDVQP